MTVAGAVRRLALCRRVSVSSCLSGLALHSAQAQETTSRLAQGTDIVAMPGIGRVIFAFLLVAALAVGAVVALRRFMPRINTGLLRSGGVQVVDRATLSAGVRVHVLRVDGQKILLAESRSGIALLALNENQGAGPGS
jgi:flagellar biogenesis protein FliO